MNRAYPSAVDWWLAGALAGVPLAIIVSGLVELGKPGSAGLGLLILGLAIGGLIAALSMPCFYTLTDRDRDGFIAEIRARMPPA